MSKLQIAAVATCILLNAIDGFDVLAISFASPGIASEWGIDRAALGIVLSMELLGMALGSVAFGGLADRKGRRPMILGCLVLMAVGMFLASTAGNVEVLSAYRFFTGLGIGGMLASSNAMVAEFSNLRRRSLAVTLMAGGYPIGVIVGGSIASLILAHSDWRAVFFFGSIVTLVFLPIAWLLLPESIEFLVRRHPPGALDQVNSTLQRMGHPAVAALPALEAKPRAGFVQLFSGDLARTTILLTVAYFSHIMVFYYILKWIPKLVVDMGYEPAGAGGVLVWANVGGATGSIILGLLTQSIGVRPLVVVALLAGTAMVVYFGQGQSDLRELSAVAAVMGFCTNAAVVGLYALFVQFFPTEVRAGGTGFVIGVGRGGAVLGPVIAGFLFEAGQPLSTVSIIMSIGSVVAAVAIICMRYPRARTS
jgi:benzoate transport